jgi:hypothetical protein
MPCHILVTNRELRPHFARCAQSRVSVTCVTRMRLHAGQVGCTLPTHYGERGDPGQALRNINMGQHAVLEGQDDARALVFQQALLKDLSVLEHLCDSGALEAEVGRIGAEQEPFLVDRMLNPAPVGPEVLAGISDPRVTSELGRFNLEANLSPRTLTGHCLRERENEALELVELVRQTAASFEAECCWEGFFPPHAKAISR